MSTPIKYNQTNSETLGDRELQVIVEGLKEPQDEQEVIKQVQTVVDGLGGNGKYVKISTSADPSKIGVIHFRSIASKIEILRKCNGNETKWTNGDAMRFKCNDNIEKRIADKTLGLIKYHIHESKKVALSDIIKWKKNAVECKGKKVAWIKETGETDDDSDMNDIAPLVNEDIKKWKDKRGLE